MYVVIFKAEIKTFDESYSKMADRMRKLAIGKYGCMEFVSCTEGAHEIAISYWPDKEKIEAWKNDPEHRQAQRLGKTRWYKSYQVQVVEILRQYGS